MPSALADVDPHTVHPHRAVLVGLRAVEVDLENRDLLLKGGMFARVEVLVGRHPNAVQIPLDALTRLEDMQYVYIVRGGKAHKVPVEITPGKHSNDHMYSFYFRNPSGWMFEYGWGGRAATYQSEYYVEDVYGHHPEAGGFGVEIGPKETTKK